MQCSLSHSSSDTERTTDQNYFIPRPSHRQRHKSIQETQPAKLLEKMTAASLENLPTGPYCEGRVAPPLARTWADLKSQNNNQLSYKQEISETFHLLYPATPTLKVSTEKKSPQFLFEKQEAFFINLQFLCSIQSFEDSELNKGEQKPIFPFPPKPLKIVKEFVKAVIHYKEPQQSVYFQIAETIMSGLTSPKARRGTEELKRLRGTEESRLEELYTKLQKIQVVTTLNARYRVISQYIQSVNSIEAKVESKMNINFILHNTGQKQRIKKIAKSAKGLKDPEKLNRLSGKLLEAIQIQHNQWQEVLTQWEEKLSASSQVFLLEKTTIFKKDLLHGCLPFEAINCLIDLETIEKNIEDTIKKLPTLLNELDKVGIFDEATLKLN